MTETLFIEESFRRIGYTIIDGVKVVQHSCVISCSKPKEMVVTMSKLNADLYKLHRGVCRDDFAVFEDAAYELQKEMLAKIEGEVSEE